jgi:hypothetical protein
VFSSRWRGKVGQADFVSAGTRDVHAVARCEAGSHCTRLTAGSGFCRPTRDTPGAAEAVIGEVYRPTTPAWHFAAVSKSLKHGKDDNVSATAERWTSTALES